MPRPQLEALEERTTPTVSFAGMGYDTPGNAMSVAAGDFNGDGKIDAVAGNSGGVTVFLNDGAGGMGTGTTMGTGSAGPRTVKVADLTGDGILDIIVGNDFGQVISVLRGNGNGTFQAPVVVTVGGGDVQGFVVVDVVGDSKPDVVVVEGDRLAVLANVGGAAILSGPTFFGVGTGGLAVDTADFNTDGKPDLIVADRDHDQLLLYIGAGGGAFGAAVPISTGVGSEPFDVIARTAAGLPLDFNGDGKTDIATGYSGNGFVGVLLGNGAGGFSTPNTFTSGFPRAGRLTAADFDADGLLDLAAQVSGGGSPTTQPVFVGDGAGGFAPGVQVSIIGDTDIVAADLNGDGRQDLLGTISFSPGILVAVLNTTPVVASFQVSAPAAVTTGVPFTVTVTAKGTGGATLTDYHGVVHFSSPDGAAVLPGDYRFTPGDAGVKTFQVTLSALGSGSFAVRDKVLTGVSLTTPVTVFRANANPTANTDTPTVAEDALATTVNVLGNDSFAPDAGETLTVTAVGTPAHGVATLVGGVVQYTPAANFNGTDTFTYTVSDGFAGPSGPGTATATVTVTVTSVNDPPTAGSDTLTVAEDAAPTVVSVLGNDSSAPDTGETLVVTGTSLAANGTVTFTGGVIRYAPATNYTGSDSFTYTLSDGNGGSVTGTVAVTVTPVNDPPTANPDFLTVAEDAAATIVSVLANDMFAPDIGETLTVTAVGTPIFGVATLVGGVVRYTPAANFNGTDSFTYTVFDGNGGTASGVVDVTVTPVNDPPTAGADTLTVAEDAAATVVPVLANDGFAPDTGETLTVASVTPPANGTANVVGGVVRYTPAANFNGTDSFTYTVSDGNGGTATATVSVTVTPVNDPPTAAADAFTVAAGGGAVGLAVLANDTTAPDAGEALSVTAVTQPAAGGTVSITGGGTGVTFTPSVGFAGAATFTYTAGDGAATSTAAVTVTVTSTPPPPAVGRPVVVGGAADGSVRTVPPNGSTSSLFPFGNTGTSTRTASADVDADGVSDVVVVTGPGTPLRVAVLSGATGAVLVVPFDPFGGNFLGGGFVSAGDLDGDGQAEFVVTPDQGGGPRVTVFSRNPDGSTVVRANFLGIDDASFRGGARTAVGDVNGDGVPDVVVAAGFGGGPRTAIFTGQSVLAGAPARLVGDFFAFPGSDATNLRNGSFVAAGDVDGDGFADLVFGGGPGGAPRVFILSGALVSAGNVAGAQASPVANFFVAGDLADRGGARVAVTNSDGDGRADVAVGSGGGRPAKVRVYLGKDFAGSGEPPSTDLDVLGGAVLADGVYVG